MARVTVLGGGNTAFSLAASLALTGHDVMLWEHPDFAHTIQPLIGNREIELQGSASSGIASLAGATTNVAEALEWSTILLCSVPSYAHEAFADQLTPHLRPGHVLALLPGNLGSLAFATALRGRGVMGVAFAESDTAPFVCRKTGPCQATIWGTVSALGIGVLPAGQTDEVLPELAQFFPGAVAHPHVLAAGLSAMNPVVHPPGVLLNAGRIERSRGEFYFYEEGVTPGVVRVIEALDAERRAIGAAMGVDLLPVAAAFHAAGFGPSGDLWSVINGSSMLTALRAPGSLETRWLTEDVPFGLVTWSRLARLASIETPIIESLISLASALTGIEFRQTGRSLEALGIDGMTTQHILESLQ